MYANMNPILAKTFGGLSKQYYFRQLFFAVLMSAFFIAIGFRQKDGSIAIGAILMLFVSTFLYPYSRFVYESIIEFIIGNNTFFVNAIFMMFVKIFTMLVCFMLAIFIAPVGLLYLYFRNSANGS